MPRLYSCVMRAFRSLISFAALLACLAGADAAVVIHVDKSSQKMSVEVDGEPRYEFAVSTGRAGYGTPNGTYHPQRLERTWFSKEYYDSPMPYSIFFTRGFAIHGSYEIRHLGGPASHGCIRLHPSNAAKLFALVKEEGVANTTIVVSGSNPPGRREVEEADAGPRMPRYAPPGAWWGYNRPYAGYGYGRSYPGYPGYPSYPRGWYGGGGPFGY
jgi:hypothetical protein